MSDWLEERVREKDKWRFATMEYGGQCATMAGIKWMLMLSADNWVLAIKQLYPSAIAILEMGKVQYYSKMSHAIKSIQTYLSQCVDFQHIGTLRRCMHTAGVICDGMMSTSTTGNQATTTSTYVTTTNILHDSTYTSHVTYTSTAPIGPGSSTSTSTVGSGSSTAIK